MLHGTPTYNQVFATIYHRYYNAVQTQAYMFKDEDDLMNWVNVKLKHPTYLQQFKHDAALNLAQAAADYSELDKNLNIDEVIKATRKKHLANTPNCAAF